MANLNNQNYCLQKELEDFVEADEAVKRNLDRKHKVEHIRSRVDDVIKRSQLEVEHRQRTYSRGIPERPPIVTETVETGPHGRRVTKSASHYSPMRPEVPLPRTAWREEPPRLERQHYSFGRSGEAVRKDSYPRRGNGESAATKNTDKNVSFASRDKK